MHKRAVFVVSVSFLLLIGMMGVVFAAEQNNEKSTGFMNKIAMFFNSFLGFFRVQNNVVQLSPGDACTTDAECNPGYCDSGTCTSYCGDGTCDSDEDCSSCSTDCEECAICDPTCNENEVCDNGKCLNIEKTNEEIGGIKIILMKILCRLSHPLGGTSYDECITNSS